MNILYTNAQSVRKKIKELEVIASDEKPEVIRGGGVLTDFFHQTYTVSIGR